MTDIPSSIDQFRIHGHQLIDFIANYLDQCSHSTIPVTAYKSPEKSYANWQQELNEPTLTPDALFEQIIHQSIHLHHPGYIGHQVAVAQPLSILADTVASLLNNGMAVYEMGQVSVAMERAVCSCLTKIIGWQDQSTGFFTSGGTLANLTALLTARQVCSAGSYWDQGHQSTSYAVMVSSEAHYCIARAIKIMGLGNDAIITIPVNKKFQLDVESINEIYNKALQQGKKIFAFVGNAASTGTGSYDDLETIGKFCKLHNIWFHVDGAHGGAVILSKKYNHLVQGLEMADSMTLDFHKLLQTSVLCTALLYKSSGASHQTFAQGAQYLYEDHEQEWYQLGKRTFECTKTMMVLKAYTLIHQLGLERLGADVDYRYELARKFADIIMADNEFELATYPQSNIVCFRYTPSNTNPGQFNQLNLEIRTRINESGQYYIVQTSIDHKIYLRTSLMNVQTTLEDLAVLLKLIKAVK
ncbi:MAG: aminotransferase class I/II-fold pyridoxal phosphate-dependent enzyme [Saprospiraceae bacterium]